MPIEVAQLRPEGVDAAIEFAKSTGCELQPQAIDPMVSLIAREDETIVAAVLGVHLTGGACELHVCLSKLDDPGTLTGELLNKALMKVHGSGTRRCQIHHHGPEDTPVNWLGEKWTGQNPSTSDCQCNLGSKTENTSCKTVADTDAESLAACPDKTTPQKPETTSADASDITSGDDPEAKGGDGEREAA